MVVVVMLVTVFASFVATSFQLVDQIPTRPNLENVFEDEQPRRRVGNSSPRSEIDETKLAGIDAAVKSALDKGEVPGAVVVVVHNDAVLYRKAYGSRAKKPAEEVMTLDTVFDLASLTKPLATATAIFKLVEAGKLKLTDKVSQHWPEFAANDKGTVTVEQCLLHTSGLIADNALADYKGDRAAAMKAIAGLKLQSPAGTSFRREVLPDVIANAGGVTVSYFEWVQDFSSFFWDEEEINARLVKIMKHAFAGVWAVSQDQKVSLRTATFIVACKRILHTRELRGLYP